jgi:hypothetical protein
VPHIYEYADFADLRKPIEADGAATGRIPGIILSRLLIPAVVLAETAWVSLVCYLVISFGISLSF